VGEAVAHESKLSLLDVLLDGVELLLLGDLLCLSVDISYRSQLRGTHLHLRIGPARDLDDHVEDRLLLIGVERDVVPWRNELAVLLDENAVLECVGRGHLAGSVRHSVYTLLGSCINCCGRRRSGGVEMACE
jgi:hypothetical protein